MLLIRNTSWRLINGRLSLSPCKIWAAFPLCRCNSSWWPKLVTRWVILLMKMRCEEILRCREYWLRREEWTGFSTFALTDSKKFKQKMQDSRNICFFNFFYHWSWIFLSFIRFDQRTLLTCSFINTSLIKSDSESQKLAIHLFQGIVVSQEAFQICNSKVESTVWTILTKKAHSKFNVFLSQTSKSFSQYGESLLASRI